MQDNFYELTEEQTEEPAPVLDHQLLCLSAVAFGSTLVSSKSLQLRVLVQGHSLLFLVDSGSSFCLIDIQAAALLDGTAPLPAPIRVHIAGGKVLHSNEFFPALTWSADGQPFTNSFRILSLKSYDSIIVHD
jgi:hypothetical protein